MKQLEQIDIKQIKQGNNQPLARVFELCYPKSLKIICSAMRCKKEDAEDVLMDSIITLRDAIVDDKYRNENVGSYLTTVAINILKNKNKKDYRIDFLEEEKLISKSGSSQVDIDSSNSKAEQIIQSINKLGEKCKNLLTRNLVDGVGLNTLVTELEYSTYDVVKTSKSRCMAKLRQIIKTDHEITML